MSEHLLSKWSATEEVALLLRDDAKAYGVAECRRGQDAFDLAGGWTTFPFRVCAIVAPNDEGFRKTYQRAFRTEGEARDVFGRVCDLSRGADLTAVILSQHGANGDEVWTERRRFGMR